MRKRSPAVLRCCGLRLILAEQLDVPTERDGGDEIFGFADLAAE
jgi:hypothetical protein